MKNGPDIEGIRSLGSLKPINSILALRFQNQNLVLVGFGNELRIYSQDLKFLHDCFIYHTSHNIYGIYSGTSDCLISIFGLGRIAWFRLLNDFTERKVKCICVYQLDQDDLFLESFNFGHGRWIIGGSIGIIRLCSFESSTETPITLKTQTIPIPQCPTLYSMKIFKNENQKEALIISGSAFSTISIYSLNLENSIVYLKQTLKGHNGVIYDIKVSDDGNQIISSSDDRKILVWRRETPNLEDGISGEYTLKYILLGHSAIVWSVDCFWDKGLVASVSEDGDLFVWNLKNPNLTPNSDPGKEPDIISFPAFKNSKVHQGRGGRTVHSINLNGFNSCGHWLFLTGGEGGDLKSWKFLLESDNNQTNPKGLETSEIDHSSILIETTACPENLESDKTQKESRKSWYQGAYLIDSNNMIVVTRQGVLSFGKGFFAGNSGTWKTEIICDLGSPIFSFSCTNSGHFVVGSSKGSVIHGYIDFITRTLKWKDKIFHQGWIENITFIKCFKIINDELYLTLSSCSRGIIGVSIFYRVHSDSECHPEWDSCTVPVKGTPKYGELKCLDILIDNSFGGKIICGTVNGNIFLLNFKVIWKKKGYYPLETQKKTSPAEFPSLSMEVSDVLCGVHKGNVSSINWINEDNSSLRFQSTGQDGKINRYLAEDKINLEWSHKWKSHCDYIVKCLKLDETNDWLIIGAVRHDLLFYLAKESVTTAPILLLKHRFGGIKRSFQINLREFAGERILEVIWCQKPEIKVHQFKAKYFFESLLNSEVNLSPLSLLESLNKNPPSRMIYSSAWLSNSVVIIGGEDHIIRFYDISDTSKLIQIHSVRLLDPIRKLKVMNISEEEDLLIVCGGRQMLEIFQVKRKEISGEMTIKRLFSNSIDKKQGSCYRFISMDSRIYEIGEEKKEKTLEVFVGSSKGEIRIFSFKIFTYQEKIELRLEEEEGMSTSFVPFSLKVEALLGEPTLIVGLSNGSIQMFRSLKKEDKSTKFNLHLGPEVEIKAHSSGVNSIILAKDDPERKDFQLLVSSGHDQKIAISKIVFDSEKGRLNGKLNFSIPNAHFSSIRDLCYDSKKRILFSVSWDQTLKYGHLNGTEGSLSNTKSHKISIWDASCISVSLDGKFILITGGSGSIQLFSIV
ncbi:WD40-repeat-containing protein [Cryptosporidium felis]|nr:WD40-repeat-containing protein [Cryptosporidium felis]